MNVFVEKRWLPCFVFAFWLASSARLAFAQPPGPPPRLDGLSVEEPDVGRADVSELATTLPHRGLFPRKLSKDVRNQWQVETRVPRSRVLSIAWSPDGKQFACGEMNGTVRIYNAETWRLTKVIPGDSEVLAVAWSPNGRWLAASTWGGAVRIWNRDGGLETRIKGSAHAVEVSCLAWSPDSERIASDYVYRGIAIRSRDGKEFMTLEKHTDTIRAIAWSPDGKQIVSGSRDGELRFWHLEKARPKVRVDRLGREDRESGPPEVPCSIHRLNMAEVLAVRWSPDGKTLATGDSAGMFRIWGPQGRLVKETRQVTPVADMDWSPGSRRLAITDGKLVRFWNREEESFESATLRADGNVRRLAWNPKSGELAGVTGIATVRIWDSKGNAKSVINGTATNAFSERPVLWSPDGQTLATCTRGTSLNLWGNDGNSKASWNPPGKRLMYVAWRPDGKLFATYTFGDPAVRFWNPDGSPGSVVEGLRGVSGIAWSRNNQKLAVGGLDGTIRIVDSTGKTEAQFEAHKRFVRHLSWSPDNRWLASAALTDDTNIRLWGSDGKAGPLLKGHASQAQSMSWHPMNPTLASIDLDGLVRLWNTDGSAGPILRGHTGQGRAVAWSPDGKWLASSSREIRLWKPDGTPGIVIPPIPLRYMDNLAWSPDGTWLSAQVHNESVRMWCADGTPGPVLQGTDLAPDSATWSPNGTHMACTTENNTVIVWDAKLGTTKWVGFALSNGETVTLGADGRFVGGDIEAFDKQYVFVRLLANGKTVLQSAHEFLSKESD